MMKKKGKTMAACLFAAVWWGIFYPELCFTEETCEAVVTAETQTEDMSGLKEEYNKRLVNLGREVLVLAPSGEFSGISAGINEKGALIVRLADGTKTEVISGEVSVRGVYGYV